MNLRSSSATVCICLSALTSIGLRLAPVISAQDSTATKVGTATDKLGTRWVISGSGTLDRGTLPLRRGNFLEVEFLGGSPTFTSSPSPRNSVPKLDKKGKRTDQPPEEPDELRNDALFNFHSADDRDFNWVRYVRLDHERGGVRFIDVMRNTGKKSLSLHIRVFNDMDIPNSDYFQGASTQRGEVINSDNGSFTPETSGVMMHLSPEFSPTLPFFIIGNARDQWTGDRRMDGYQLRLEYNGTLEPGKRAVLVHWIGARTPKEKGKPEKAMERFISGTRLIDHGVPAEWQADVINFSKDAFEPAPPAPPTTGVKLVMLDEFCKRAGIKRDHKDLLVLDRDAKIEGRFKGAKIVVSRGGLPIAIPLEQVAAISGGAGMGREHHMYLRDGSVLAGRITLEDATFTGEVVGMVALNVDALDKIVLGTSLLSDGRVGKTAGVLTNGRGEVLYLEALPSKPLVCRTASGAIELSWAEIASIRERASPDPGFIVSLKDGSRVMGLPYFGDSAMKLTTGDEWNAETEMTGYASSPTDLETLLAVEKDSDARPAVGWCEMTRGALWSGHPVEGKLLQIEATSGLTVLKSEEIKSVRRSLDAMSGFVAGIVFDVELAKGPKLRGRFITPALRWLRAGHEMSLPWAQIVELNAEGMK